MKITTINMNTNIERIAGLDGLRGIAAIIVLLSHMSAWGYNLLPGLNFSGFGRSGVILFFLLSSYLLSTQIIKIENLLNPITWVKYLEARIFRIWPLFIVVILFSYVTSNLQSLPIIWHISPYVNGILFPMTWESLQDHLLMQRGEEILWTIPVEFKFYLMLPPILVTVLFIFKNKLEIVMLILAISIAVLFWYYPVAEGTVKTLPFLSVFLTGTLLAFMHQYEFKIKPLMCEIMAWVFFAIMIFYIPSINKLITGNTLDSPNILHCIYTPIWSVILFGMLTGTGIMRSILESRLLVFFGKISFSLYIWHMLPIHLMASLSYYNLIDLLPYWIKGCIIFFLSTCFAYLSYCYIEYPIQKWKKRNSLCNFLTFMSLKTQ